VKNNSFQEIWEKLKSCKNVVMSLHIGPDGDSLGSCTALKYVLERDLNCNVTLVSCDELSDSLASLSFSKEVLFGKDLSDLDLESFDVLICLDLGDNVRLSAKLRDNFNVPNDLFIINIDHHKTNPFYGTLNYVDDSAPSACSVLVDFFKEINVHFDAELSKRLLLGICTDSGFFTYDGKKSLEQAIFLINQGADYMNDIVIPVKSNIPLRLLQFNALLIDNIKFNTEKKFAYSLVKKEDVEKLNLNFAEVRLGIDALRDIEGIDFVFNLVEFDQGIKGSFRSHKVDVSLFAKELNGGGHKYAAGFGFKDSSLEEAEKRVLEVIDRIGIHKD